MKIGILIAITFLVQVFWTQDDSLLFESIQLKGFTVHSLNSFDSKRFMNQVMQDSSFYQAFKNLRFYNHHSIGKIWVYNKKHNEKAFEYIEVDQKKTGGLMFQEKNVIETQGKLRNRKGELRFVTASMYYDLFFPEDTVYVNPEITNIHDEPYGNSKFAEYKHQLKLMMFNPGEDIKGVPIVGKKMSIFDEDMLKFYDYKVSEAIFQHRDCYLFTVQAKPEFSKSKTVVKTLFTYFDKKTMNVLQREYYMEYSSFLFQFKVKISVENRLQNSYLLPYEIKYNGWWDVPFKTTETLKFHIINSHWIIP